MQRFGTWLAGAALALPLALSAQAQAQTTTWIMASGHPDNNFLTQNIRLFIEDVERESGGRLKIDLRSNNTLIKLDAIKRAVQTGQVQAGEIRFGVYSNEDPVYQLDNVINIVTNYDEARLLTQAQEPYFDALFGKNNMRVITYMPWPGQGFYTKTPVNTVADFKGKKLRIFSLPTQQMGEALGFQATILPFAEVPQAFATGLIDSMFTSAQTGLDTQAWDYVKYFTYTGTLHSKNALIVNERALRQLPADVRQIVLDAGKRATARGFEMSQAASIATMQQLRENGIDVSEQAPASVQAALAKVGETMMADWRKTATPAQQKVLDAYLALKKQVGQ